MRALSALATSTQPGPTAELCDAIRGALELAKRSDKWTAEPIIRLCEVVIEHLETAV